MKTSTVIVKFFADYVSSQLGIIYSETNYYQLETRLADVAKAMNFPTVEDLYVHAQKGISVQLKNLLLDFATNNETLFFRDPPAFAAIEKAIESNAGLWKSRPEPFRVWSAACSYGQEVYSLAMILDRMRTLLPASGYEIVATDVSSRALKAAEEGIYSEMNVARGLDPVLRDRYFLKQENTRGETEWRARAELRRGMKFINQNLLDSFDHLGSFDMILCRNVLIYQTTDSRKGIVSKLYNRLRPGGIFILGSSESLLGISEEFETERHERATLYRRKGLLKAS
ncbi:MAG: protein-glutamate O-methyltransferase CheR [Bdellovibrionota bacterium]|nr:MAG: protein-glutamate O-methyltransferase CheR [Pseudomonadota bacterium]